MLAAVVAMLLPHQWLLPQSHLSFLLLLMHRCLILIDACHLQLLAVFKTAPELCTLLRTVEGEYKKAREQHSRARSEGPHADVLPWIQSQVQTFEAGAIASVRDNHVATTVWSLLHAHSQR